MLNLQLRHLRRFDERLNLACRERPEARARPHLRAWTPHGHADLVELAICGRRTRVAEQVVNARVGRDADQALLDPVRVHDGAAARMLGERGAGSG